VEPLPESPAIGESPQLPKPDRSQPSVAVDPRRRTAWRTPVVIVVACLAAVAGLIAAGITAYFVSRHGGSTPIGGSRPSRSARAVNSASSSSPAVSARSTLSTSAPLTTRPATGTPCPSSAACTVSGDAGGVVAALNRFRVSHGVPAVPGSASSQAQQCALDEGAGPACAPHFAWEVVPVQDGARVISLIASRGGQWLLDPGMTSFSVGWAFVPSSRQYECAILKVA
jgi:hypothetical protein